MARNFVFITTTGQTDIQVVALDAKGKPWRYSIAKGCQRRFHDACVGGRIPWHMRSFADMEEVRERRHMDLELDAAGTRLSTLLSENRPDDVALDVATGVELCAPLLARCCRQVRDGKLGRAVRALLLTTRRDPPDDTEPVAVFTLVRDELARALDLAPDAVEELVFVTERDLYETDERGQRHLRASACRRLDEGLRRLAALHRQASAVVSDVAGVPETKPVLAASATYRFPDVRFLRPTEEGRNTDTRRVTLVPPAESLMTRDVVARLVRRGGFNEALAIARHGWGARVEEAEPWRCWLGHVVAVLEGIAPRDLADRLRRQSESAICRALLPVCAGGPTLAVGFRAENALRRQSWSAALRETFTFPEIAFLELVNRCLARTEQPCLYWNQNVFHPRLAKLSAETSALLAREHPSKDRVHLYDDRGLLASLRQDLPEPVRRALKNFDDALKPVRAYRNVATHACLDESCIADARDKLEQAGVWPDGQPTRFLDGAPAAGVLAAVGHPDAARLYGNLVEAVIQDLDDHSFGEAI